MRYAIFRNEDGTETGMCEAAAFRSHSEDTDGRPMRVVREIEAESWDEAIATYRGLLDSGALP